MLRPKEKKEPTPMMVKIKTNGLFDKSIPAEIQCSITIWNKEGNNNPKKVALENRFSDLLWYTKQNQDIEKILGALRLLLQQLNTRASRLFTETSNSVYLDQANCAQSLIKLLTSFQTDSKSRSLTDLVDGIHAIYLENFVKIVPSLERPPQCDGDIPKVNRQALRSSKFNRGRASFLNFATILEICDFFQSPRLTNSEIYQQPPSSETHPEKKSLLTFKQLLKQEERVDKILIQFVTILQEEKANLNLLYKQTGHTFFSLQALALLRTERSISDFINGHSKVRFMSALDIETIIASPLREISPTLINPSSLSDPFSAQAINMEKIKSYGEKIDNNTYTLQNLIAILDIWTEIQVLYGTISPQEVAQELAVQSAMSKSSFT